MRATLYTVCLTLTIALSLAVARGTAGNIET